MSPRQEKLRKEIVSEFKRVIDPNDLSLYDLQDNKLFKIFEYLYSKIENLDEDIQDKLYPDRWD